MKTGLEVEGQHCGIRTLFCQYEELDAAIAYARADDVADEAEDADVLDGIAQIYVQDQLLQHTGRVKELDAVAKELGIFFTFEVPRLPVTAQRVNSIEYMISVPVDPVSLGLFSDNVRDGDQVKLTANLFVATTQASGFELTEPSAFEGDVEIS